ncbi:MAG: helix-turn-helix domain-containing protein [Acidimicrobiales bacterium]
MTSPAHHRRPAVGDVGPGGVAGETVGEEGIHQPLTVRSVLDEPLLRRAEVHAADLDRPVEWCLPLPEALDEPGSLAGVVVIAGGGLADLGPAGAEAALRQLADAGAGALFVIGPDAGGGVTDWLVPMAVACDLPVVVPPPEATYRRLSRLVGEKSLTRHAHVLAYGIGVQRELADVLYRGAGLTAMARRVSRLSGRPVYVLGNQLEVLAYESLATAAVPDPDELVRTLQDAITAGRVDPAPKDQDLASVLVTLPMEHGAVSCVVAPMVLGGATYGWVAIVEMEEPPHRHDVAQHLVLAQQAAMTAGSEILRLRSVEEAKERARGDFVHALLHERFASSHELTSRAAFHQFDVGAAYVVAVAAGAFDPATAEGMAQLRRMTRQVQQLDGTDRAITMSTSVGDLLVVVRQVGAGKVRSRDVAKEQLTARAYATALEAALTTSAAGDLRVAFGRTGLGQPGVMHSYREARIALEIAARVRREGVAGYADLRVLAILSDLAQRPDASAFADDILDPLRRPGRQDGDLDKVVFAYLTNGGNLNATSRELFMHRNTVLYKLDKAAQLLGMDLRVAENRFTVWLARNIHMLGEVEAAVDREINPAP